MRALVEGDHIARVAAAELDGGAALAAWVTYFVEGASDGAPRGQDLAATLAVRAASPGGLGKLNVLSQMASSLGGDQPSIGCHHGVDATGGGWRDQCPRATTVRSRTNPSTEQNAAAANAVR